MTVKRYKYIDFMFLLFSNVCIDSMSACTVKVRDIHVCYSGERDLVVSEERDLVISGERDIVVSEERQLSQERLSGLRRERDIVVSERPSGLRSREISQDDAVHADLLLKNLKQKYKTNVGC